MFPHILYLNGHENGHIPDFRTTPSLVAHSASPITQRPTASPVLSAGVERSEPNAAG